MGGRQSIQTDVHRRPRSNSAINASEVRNAGVQGDSSLATIVGGSVVGRRDMRSEGISDSEEEPPGPSSSHYSRNENRQPPIRFSIPHLRPHRSGLALSQNSARRSMPFFQLLSRFSHDIKCPVCQKTVPSDDAEIHLVMCFTRPRITYNEDILMEDKGECAICLEEMLKGGRIARLPCLCIYHKNCIDDWFSRKNCCPEHPGDD